MYAHTIREPEMALDEKTCTPDAMPGKMKLDYILASAPSSCPPSSSAIARLSTQSSAFPSPQTHPQIPLSPLSEPSDSVPTTYDATVTSLQESMLVLPDSRHSCRCGKTFPRFLNYLWHLSTNTPGCDIIEGPLYPCHVPSCQSAFRRKTDRTKHVSCVHSKMRPFKCDAPGCSSAFFFSKDVKKHYSTVHLKHRPFKCEHCASSFGKKEHLKNHVSRTHLRIKPFGCKVCNVLLASKHNLVSHTKTRAHRRAERILLEAAGQQVQLPPTIPPDTE